MYQICSVLNNNKQSEGFFPSFSLHSYGLEDAIFKSDVMKIAETRANLSKPPSKLHCVERRDVSWPVLRNPEPCFYLGFFAQFQFT